MLQGMQKKCKDIGKSINISNKTYIKKYKNKNILICELSLRQTVNT